MKICIVTSLFTSAISPAYISFSSRHPTGYHFIEKNPQTWQEIKPPKMFAVCEKEMMY
jgi:hypothetical protein